ncbi:hypothetical protein [Dyella sp.]|uniref:hypothetical protein n=1 Tax=Dyella sp. TaxID=1869338 RepID=UPI002ED25F35
MKLLRDFFRMRTAGRFPLAGRAGARQTMSITVPAPLQAPAVVEPKAIELDRKIESRKLLVARWEEVPPQAPRHLELVSSL